MSKVVSLIKWHGGKYYLCKRIISHFPEHKIYLEPFGGGATVLLNKELCEVEAYNDINQRVTRLFRVIRDHKDEFLEKVRLTLYSQIEFNEASTYPENATETDKAILDFIRWRQSRGGTGKDWSCTTGRARGGMAGDVNAWWNAIEGLPWIIDRIRRVEITDQSAFKLIPKFDDKDCLIYCDPTYLHETREKNSRDTYEFELSDDEHELLGKLLNVCISKVMISGYRSEMYDYVYKDWRRVDFDIACHAAGGKEKKRRTECIWMNY